MKPSPATEQQTWVDAEAKKWTVLDVFTRGVFGCAPSMFRENPRWAIGCLLQWIALAIVVTTNQLAAAMPLVLSVVSALLGVLALFGGLILAAGRGPVLWIPALLGIALLVIICCIVYPLRFFFPEEESSIGRRESSS
ncbi:MAG: hypothetical protein K1X74_01510 [Pirellulales bacterium]|nr:hypothetical protein [Pirellulales bacterium]